MSGFGGGFVACSWVQLSIDGPIPSARKGQMFNTRVCPCLFLLHSVPLPHHSNESTMCLTVTHLRVAMGTQMLTRGYDNCVISETSEDACVMLKAALRRGVRHRPSESTFSPGGGHSPLHAVQSLLGSEVRGNTMIINTGHILLSHNNPFHI